MIANPSLLEAPVGQLERNHRNYESEEVIRRYEARTDLYPAEQVVLERLQGLLFTARVLDLGVGTGRTTGHLISCAREYVGLDYAVAMVNSCQRRYPAEQHPNARFVRGDARRLTGLRDQAFDFVLFSYNGLDCVDHEDRLRALAEIHRVLAPGGWFCFSAHNLQVLPWFPCAMRPRQMMEWCVETFRLLAYNRGLMAQLEQPYAVIRDAGDLSLYYIRPEAQVAQLEQAGFEAVEVLSGAASYLGADSMALQPLRDPWLYYLCRKPL